MEIWECGIEFLVEGGGEVKEEGKEREQGKSKRPLTQVREKRIWAHLPPLSLTLASPGMLGGYPRHKMYQNQQKSCFRTRNLFQKMIASENMPQETAIRKLTLFASLQCADRTAGRKFTMDASSQKANKTALQKFTLVVLTAAFMEASCCQQVSSARRTGRSPLGYIQV